jgi:hypothetical protein
LTDLSTALAPQKAMNQICNEAPSRKSPTKPCSVPEQHDSAAMGRTYRIQKNEFQSEYGILKEIMQFDLSEPSSEEMEDVAKISGIA